VAATVLANLARHTPLLPNADRLMLVDVDDTVKPELVKFAVCAVRRCDSSGCEAPRV
jgi:hypothetical protein